MVSGGTPIVQAPMAGISTPQLAAAVCEAGGLGFVAGGLRTPASLAEQLQRTRALTARPFGVNLFVPGAPGDPAAVRRYAERLAPLAERAGVELGEPRWGDDHFAAKLELVLAAPPAVVSFTFGCPEPSAIAALRDAGAEVWLTVTSADEARRAAEAGADAVVAQGAEAGGHRGAWHDGDDPPLRLGELLEAVTAEAGVPVIAAGGLMNGTQIAGALAAGAAAAQLGTAFMLAPEAATRAAHRTAIAARRPTILTRAFTGRTARSIVNAWTARGDDAPAAYPELLHLTAPLRAHGGRTGDADLMSLWAGTGHADARALPAGAIVRELMAELDVLGGP